MIIKVTELCVSQQKHLANPGGSIQGYVWLVGSINPHFPIFLKSPQWFKAGVNLAFSPAGEVTARTMDIDFSPEVLSLAVANLNCSATVGGRTLLAETMVEEESEA